MGFADWKSTTRLGLMCSGALIGITPALAQDAPPAEQGGGLEEIIVTARRQQENLQNIPVAATVVSAERLQNFGINSVEKLSTMAPQLIVGRSGTGNGASIGLRGISVNASSISLEQSVALVIDGVYYSGGRALNLGMFDMAQVEVLKGPQSLFYGKNTTAGAISFTTANPTDHFEGMVRAGYEFKGRNPSVEGYVSGPVSDTLSLRLAARYTKQFRPLIENVSEPGTSYTRDVATGVSTAHARQVREGDGTGERDFTTRFTAKFEPNDSFTATLKGTYDKYASNAAHSSTVVGVCEKGFVQTDPKAPCGKTFRHVQSSVPSDIAATLPLIGREGGNPYLSYEAYNITGNFEYDAGPLTLSVTPAYSHSKTYWGSDADFTDAYLTRDPALGTGGNFAASFEGLKAFSVEARARTKFDGMFNAMVGAYYQNSTLAFVQEIIFPGGPENSAATDPSWRYQSLLKRGQTKGKTYAIFGQAIVDLTPTLTVTGGIRYTEEKKHSIQGQPYVIPTSLGSFAQTTFVVPQKFTNTSPEATISWKPAPNVTVYGSYRTGYKSGGYSISGIIAPNSTVADADFGPEKVKGFEGGIKSTLLNNQLRVNFDIFSYKYTGLQVDFFNPLTIQYLTLNAASARTKGAEIEMEFAPRSVPGLNLRASASYTKARYLSFPMAPCIGGQSRAEGCSFALNGLGNGTRQDLSGQIMPQAPRITATAGVDYSTPVGAGLKLGLSFSGRYSSRYKTYAFAPDNADRFFQSAYAAIDASIRLGAEDERWELALIGKNLTNRFIMTTAQDLTYTGSGAGSNNAVHTDVRSSISDPRTVAVQATARF